MSFADLSQNPHLFQNAPQQQMGGLERFSQGMAGAMGNPLFQMGAGILAANQPGASFGQAMGQGAQYGIQQQMLAAQQKRKEKLVDKELEHLEAEMKRADKISKIRDKIADTDPGDPSYAKMLSMAAVMEGQLGVAMGLNMPRSQLGLIGYDEEQGRLPEGTLDREIATRNRPSASSQPSWNDAKVKVFNNLMAAKVATFEKENGKRPNAAELSQMQLESMGEVSNLTKQESFSEQLVKHMLGVQEEEEKNNPKTGTEKNRGSTGASGSDQGALGPQKGIMERAGEVPGDLLDWARSLTQ